MLDKSEDGYPYQAKFEFAIDVRRRGGPFAIRYFVVSCILSSSGLILFHLKNNVDDRVSAALGLLLSTISYSFSIRKNMPEAGFLTLPDWYMFWAFLYIILLCIVFVILWWIDNADEDVDTDHLNWTGFKIMAALQIVSILVLALKIHKCAYKHTQQVE